MKYKEVFKEQIKDMAKEEAIKYLEEMKFKIDMIDHWDNNDIAAWDALWDLIKEIKGEK